MPCLLDTQSLSDDNIFAVVMDINLLIFSWSAPVTEEKSSYMLYPWQLSMISIVIAYHNIMLSLSLVARHLKENFLAAMAQWEQATCITFVEQTTEKDYIVLTQDD